MSELVLIMRGGDGEFTEFPAVHVVESKQTGGGNPATKPKKRVDVITPTGYLIPDALSHPPDEDFQTDVTAEIANNNVRIIARNIINGTWRDVTDSATAVSLISPRGSTGTLMRIVQKPRDKYLSGLGLRNFIPITKIIKHPAGIAACMLTIPPPVNHPVYKLSAHLSALAAIHRRGLIYGRPWQTFNGHFDIFCVEYAAAFDARDKVWELINEQGYQIEALQYLPANSEDALPKTGGAKKQPKRAQPLTQGDFLSLFKLATLYDIKRVLSESPIAIAIEVSPKLIRDDAWPIDTVLNEFARRYEL